MSLFAWRKPSVAQTWQRVRQNQTTGIPNEQMTHLAQEPTREDLETWAIQSGHDPVCYITAWVCLAERAAHQKDAKASGEEKKG